MNVGCKWAVLTVLPTDYTEYGGNILRWRLMDLDYPDCSSGCKWFIPLHDAKQQGADYNWGVCVNKNSPRSGLLTWKHQAGLTCFERNKDK